MAIILETERLLLREFAVDDINDFYVLVSDPEVVRYTGDFTGSIDEAQQAIQDRIISQYQIYGYGCYAVVYKGAGTIIGWTGLKYLKDYNEIDLGYRFLKDYWGQGFATEACRAVVEYGFQVLKLPRIVGCVDTRHKASIRVLEKIGFGFEKLTRDGDVEDAWYAIESPDHC